MQQVSSISTLRRSISQIHRAGKRIAFVPTMGALHTGHLSLIRRARQTVGSQGRIVVSIFINPPQFNQKSDLLHYPRPLAIDTRLCRKMGVDLLFTPSARTMYPSHFSTWVEEKSLSVLLCGASRPGHFRGVCTIVLKLFNLIQPVIAFFGQKDAQQALVIKRIAQDLNCPIRIIIAPTVRERDGLAMSSRNQHLKPVERIQARALSETLNLMRSSFKKGNPKKIRNLGLNHLKKAPGLQLNYLEIVDPLTLRPVQKLARGNLIVVAAYIGRTRLIDNVRL